MQPLQYDLQSSAAKDNSITHAAAAPSNLDAASTMRSVETELQSTIELCRKLQLQNRISTPKRKKDDFEALFQRSFKRKITSAKIATIFWQITVAAWMQPLQYDLQSSAAKDDSITHAAAATSNLDAAITMRFATSRRKPARIYTHNNTRTPNDNSHAAIPMRSATGDSKTPYNYAHTSTPKAASSHHYTAAKKNDKPTAAAPVAHTRYLSSSPAATLHGKTQGFVLRLPPQDIAHVTSCSHYNAVRSINSQTCTYLRTEQHQNTKWQQSCSHSNAICKHRFQNTL